MAQVLIEARREWVDSVVVGGEVIAVRLQPGRVERMDEALFDALKNKGAKKNKKSTFAKAFEPQQILNRNDPSKSTTMPPVLRLIRAREAQAKADGDDLFDSDLYPKAPLQVAVETFTKTGNEDIAHANAAYTRAVAEAKERLPASEVPGAEALAETQPETKTKKR